MANQDFSALLAAAPDAKPAAGAQPQGSTTASKNDFSALLAAAPDAPASARPSAGGGNVESFVRQYAPLAQRVGEQLGVAPEALLGQWGLETGWGRSVIPGTNNLGNIKDFTGRGQFAVDNMTGSRDAYRVYENPEAFGEDFAGLLGRRYQSAIGSGSDAERFFSELKAGGYAEDPAYVQKGVAATRMAAQALGQSAPQARRVGDYTNIQPVTEQKRTFGEAVKDVGLAGAAGIAQGVEMVAGAFGADNAVARFASDFADDMYEAQSPARQAERQSRAEAIRQAEESGSTWEEVKANVGAFTDAPVESTINALATSAPTILTALIPGLNKTVAARLVASGVMGAAQGAGAVKGGIYEQVQSKLIESGLDPVEAERIALAAQAYDSENGANIAGGAILGALAGTTGIEGVVSRVMGARVAEDLVSKGVIRRAGEGAIKEAPIEGIQGGQQRYATNVALQNEGFDVPAFQGVAGQAAGEAIASAPGGAIFGAMDTGGGQPLPPELAPAAEKAQEPDSPLSRAAVAGAEQVIANKQASEQSAPADPISERVRQIEQEVRANGVLETLRTIGQRGLTEKEFLEALSIARNTQMDERSPLIRQRALESLEEAMSWAREGRMPGVELSQSTELAAQPTPPQPGTNLAPIGPRDLGPVGAGQFFDPNVVDVDATRVDNMLPGPRAIEGPRPSIGTDQGADAQQAPIDTQSTGTTAQPANTSETQQPAAPAQDAPAMEMPASTAADIASQSRALSVEEATRGLPPVQIPAATDQERGEAGTAMRRKRKAQLRQLAEAGFDDVVRSDSGFTFINTRSGKRVALDTPADAALARAAIADTWNAKSNAAATSPQNDLREPSEANINAGNWKRGETHTVYGARFRSENPAGSIRRGVDKDGKPWETTMVHNYGEFVDSEGADGDPVDGFVIGPGPVWVIDQVNKDGTFDEHKLVVGPKTEEAARAAYLANYEPGWTGLGSIKQIPAEDLRGWLKKNSKKPAAESDAGVVEVKAGKNTYRLSAVDVSSLPSDSQSTPRGNEPNRINAKQALLIKGMAGFFGKDVIFFDGDRSDLSDDGFVVPGDAGTIYLNTRSTISHMAVFGHELLHTLRMDNPKAYDAIKKVLAANVVNARGFRSYYDGTKVEDTRDGELADAELEELASDLNGDLLTDGAFWKSVFDQIQRDNGKEAKGIIAQLSAFLQRMIADGVKAFSGLRNFNSSRFVKDMEAVKSAYRDALSQWAKDQGITKAAMQAEILRTQQKMGEPKRSAPRPDDGLTVEAYHFSKQPRQILSTGFFGTGLRGSDRDEIMSATDSRLRDRLSFYVNKGTGIRPEAGVGGIAHKATLTNIYDADADTKRLKRGRDKRGFETAVLNAGYSGYLSRLDGSQPGQVILLGRQAIQPEVLGFRTQIDDAKPVPAPAQREKDLGDRLMANKSLPAGMLTPSRWAEVLMASEPELAAQLMEIGALDGGQGMYKDELAAKARRLSGDIKRSTQRAKDEYAEVEAKFKGTDQWMKAPNGNPSNLSERQWVQVRTPAFKKWFGDWESAISKPGGVWNDNSVSKVVDENGEPMVVYHGTDKGGFTAFATPSGSGRGDLGIFTTNNWDMARSYVRRGRAEEIELADLPTDRKGLEALDFVFEENEKTGRVEVETPFGDSLSYASEEAAVADILDSYADDINEMVSGEQRPGIYALFLNIRNPSESDFEGATWNGERFDQWIVEAGGEQQFDESGKGFFTKEEALEIAEAFVSPEEREEGIGPDYYIRPADEHPETTDTVVEDARRYNHDGAIIRNVVDDGGGPGAYDMTPSEVFVALRPNQVKSADYNNGEFREGTYDLRRSKKRAQDPADGDKTDIAKIPVGKSIPLSVAVGGLENSLSLARSKTYRRGRDLKKELQDRVLAAAKTARVNLSERTKSTHAFLSNMVYEDALFALKSNENAVGWYDQKVSRAIGALSTIHPEINRVKRARLAFLWALATTSNGLKVDKNFELAERAYRQWKETGRMPTNIGIGNAAKAINKGMAAYNSLAGKVGEERLLKFMGTKFEVGQIERMLDMKVGGEWKSTPVRGAAILGPKIGNGFFSNLNGYFDALTMDRWLMRTWGRMTGTLLDVTKQDIDASRKKLAEKIADMSDAERRAMSKLIGLPVKKTMTRAELDAAAKASQKASMKKDKREVMMAAEGTNEFRKAANLHHMTLDGQKEAPSGPAERNWIRAIFQTTLDRLQADGFNMTMSDLQALLWYPERRLYDAAKSEEDVANGYEDDEAPDYANAAYNLALSQGIEPDVINAAMDVAEKRGTVKGEQLTEEEKSEMLDQFRSAPVQPFQIAFEVAPDPDNVELTERWNALDAKQKAGITDRVRKSIVRDLANSFGIKGDTVQAVGGYEGFINPNLILEFKKKEMSLAQSRAFSSALGLALDQKSIALLDGRGDQSVGIVRIKLSEKADKHVAGIMKAIGEALPGVQDFTARGNNIDILNFSEYSTDELASKIVDAVDNYEGDIDSTISFGNIKSELIEKADYESEILGLGPEPGQRLLERARAARRDAREFLAAELSRASVKVPGRSALARRDDAGSAAETAGGADAGSVSDAGGVRRSTGRLDAPGREDQGPGREEDGSLRGLPRDFKVGGVEIRASHWEPAARVARQYMESRGLEYRPPSQYVKVDKERAARIAAEYDRMKHDPKNPVVRAAFKALADETIAQYEAVMSTGLKVEFIDFAAQGDPYAASPRLATEDVRNNNHFWVFSTRDGYGTADFDTEDNPMLAETDFVISGQRALVNDLFRVVHDYFGHIKEGVGFRADGEENAWRAHSAMFSPLAQRALTTETRGQNSWVNFGPYGEKNRTASAGETHFADQKTGLLPLWVSEEGRYDDIQRSRQRASSGDDTPVIQIGDVETRPEPREMRDEVEAQDARGRQVSYEVTIEDTGDTARVTVDAGQAIKDYDDRIGTMKKLLECLRK